MAEMGLDTGLIDQHAPRTPETGKEREAQYQPTPEEERTLKLVERLFSKAKRHRSLYDRNWTKFYRLFRGQQWDTRRPSYRHQEVVNHIFKSIQSTVPIQMDSRPRFEFLPEEPSDMPLAEILNEAIEADWTKNNWALELLEVIYDANLYGAGMSSLLHDPKANYSAGKICYESADPLYFFPDPAAKDVNKKCGYAIYAEPLDVAKIKRMYPDKREFIKADLLDLSRNSKTENLDRWRSPTDNAPFQEDAAADNLDDEKALLLTCWISPEQLVDQFTEEESKDVDPETGAEKVSYVQKAKYPNGRKIVKCGKVLLEDVELGYDDHQIPYQRLLNYVLPREFWGISEVEQLEGPQKTFNKLLNFALDVLTLMGNPIWVVDTSAGIDTDNLVNKPGLVVEKTQGSEVRREEGVQLQPYVLQLTNNMVEWFNEVSGSQDVSRGVQPTGITAASAISSLQEAAQTRLRQKARNLDYYLQSLGQQWLSRTFQFRTAPEIFRLTGKEGAEKYFRMHVEDYEKTEEQMIPDAMGIPVPTQVPTGEMGKRVTVQPYLENGQMDPTQQQQFETQGKFDVRVVTGSSLPFAKAEKEERLFKLLEVGAIDNEEVLKGLEYPNWQAVQLRMQEAAAAQAQAEMQAQMAAKAPQGGQPPPV